MSELLICPFCGGEAMRQSFQTAAETFTRYRVKCSNCWCETDWESTSLEDATEKWNTRYDDRMEDDLK